MKKELKIMKMQADRAKGFQTMEADCKKNNKTFNPAAFTMPGSRNLRKS